MRKRSRAITLILLGTASGLLVGCTDPEVETAVYKDVESCIASGKYLERDCRASFDEAKIDNDKNAPAFTTQKECEEEFGSAKCQPAASSHPATSSGSSPWVPYMMGYMMGNNSGTTRVYPQAVYQDTNRNFVNSGGSFITKQFGSAKMGYNRTTAGTPKTAAPTRTTTVSRGGFGGKGVSIS